MTKPSSTWGVLVLIVPMACSARLGERNDSPAAGAAANGNGEENRSGSATGEDDNNPQTTAFRDANDGEWPAVGLLTEEDSQGIIKGACTAFLVGNGDRKASSVLMTAKHCGNGSNNFYLGTGTAAGPGRSRQTLLCDGKMVRYDVSSGANALLGSGNYDSALNEPGYNDVQLAFLMYPVANVRPLALMAPGTAPAGLIDPGTEPVTPLTFVGFGRRPDGKGGMVTGIKHLLPIKIQRTTETGFIQPIPAACDTCSVFAAKGDSGGPLTVVASGVGLRVAAVLWGSLDGGLSKTFSRVDVSNVYEDAMAEINRHANPRAGAGGYQTCDDYRAGRQLHNEVAVDAGVDASAGDPGGLGIR